MKPKAYILVFGGLADWELAHALCEINKSGKFDVVSVGFSANPVTTMGGLKLSPDISLDEVTPAGACIFMLPGGDMWERESHENLKTLLRRLHVERVPIGAICGATLEIARAGLTKNIRHTSNSKDYLKAMVADYNDENFYVNELAVTDQNIITASGLGCVEFAREVIKRLNIYNEADTRTWFEMFKHGVYPASEGA
jgi:putative intracellular protease/amidase